LVGVLGGHVVGSRALALGQVRAYQFEGTSDDPDANDWLAVNQYTVIEKLD